MALTLQQQVRLMQNLLAVRIGTAGTRASKITTAGEALYSVYSGVSASVLWYFSTTGASPVLGGVSFTRTAGFWTICPIPEGFVPTHFKLDTEPGGWSAMMQAAGRIRLTAWWAREQEVNHIALAAAAGQPETGFWRGDVQSVSIGGTVSEGGSSATSTATLERVGEVPLDPAPDVAGTILVPIPDGVELGRWGSLVIAPWFDFSTVDYSFVIGATTHYSHHIGGTGIVAVKFINETPTAPAYDTVIPANCGWSPAVALRGHFA